MKHRVSFVGCQYILLLVAVALMNGCGNSKKDNGEKEKQGKGSSTDKPHVLVRLGSDNYKKAAAQLAQGKTVKFKGELALAGSKGKRVVVHLAELYTGEMPAVQAAELTKDFMTDRKAAEKKYNPKKKLSPEIIVEGEIAELQADSFAVQLAGHEE